MKKLFIIAISVVLFSLCPVVQAQSHSVTLSWKSGNSLATFTYNVYRETSSGACTATTIGSGPGCLRLNVAPLTATVFTDTTPPVGASFYVVRAISGTCPNYPCVNESVNSNEVSVLLQAPIAPPVLNPPVVI